VISWYVAHVFSSSYSSSSSVSFSFSSSSSSSSSSYYYYYLLKLSFHWVAVVLTPVQTKQIRINIHKRNNTKIQYKQHKTQ